jgi:hypothetical protein
MMKSLHMLNSTIHGIFLFGPISSFLMWHKTIHENQLYLQMQVEIIVLEHSIHDSIWN